jgi:hypothetical protein
VCCGTPVLALALACGRHVAPGESSAPHGHLLLRLSPTSSSALLPPAGYCAWPESSRRHNPAARAEGELKRGEESSAVARQEKLESTTVKLESTPCELLCSSAAAPPLWSSSAPPCSSAVGGVVGACRVVPPPPPAHSLTAGLPRTAVGRCPWGLRRGAGTLSCDWDWRRNGRGGKGWHRQQCEGGYLFCLCRLRFGCWRQEFLPIMCARQMPECTSHFALCCWSFLASASNTVVRLLASDYAALQRSERSIWQIINDNAWLRASDASG